MIREVIFEYPLVSACFSFQKDEYCDSILAVEQISNADGLIGSSSSRQVLFEELQRDVQISESIDRAKEEKKVEEEKAADMKVQVSTICLLRVYLLYTCIYKESRRRKSSG